MAKFKDDKIEVIESDVEKIRKRPSMYMASLSEAGCLHICKEIIDNNRDECFKKDSPGNTIWIDITSKYITAKDNGRGIPTNLLRVVHETNQAGSNMTRSGGATSGENGTGTTVITAMAKKLIVTSYRPIEKKKLTIEYHEGILVREDLEDYNGAEHGLETTFYPSNKILGVDEIPVEQLVGWIKDMDYTLPEGINLHYTVNGKEFQVNHKSLDTYLEETLTDLADGPVKYMCQPLHIICESDIIERYMEKDWDRHFTIEASLVYTDPAYRGEDIRTSWMNMIYTMQNGTHVDGVIDGFSRAITEAVVKKKKSLEGEDIRKDIRAHLQVVVKATCTFAHIFSSQAKHHVFPKNLGKAIEDETYKYISSLTAGKLNEIVDIVIANNRVRKAGEQARDITKQTKTKQWDRPSSFIPCASIKTPEPKELFLVEGLSAGGGLRACRDARYQAILQFRGKNLNIWDLDLDRAMKSDTWLDLIKVLGCGIGPTFDMKKLRFDKIIIATDADVDGYHIRVGFCSFFLKFLPEIIRAGKLYIAEPPLYELKQRNVKDAVYVATQTEYIQKCIESIGNIQIEFPEKK